MGYRILVDENIDPRTADILRDRDHDAGHVGTILGKGTKDGAIAKHAREQGLLVLTNDTGFLRPGRSRGVKILYVPENSMQAHEIADRIDELSTFVPDQTDLPAVTWISDTLSS